MTAPAVNVVDALLLDEQVINSLASQLSRGVYQKELRLVLTLTVTAYLFATKRQSPGQSMQNLKCMNLACALGIILPAAAPFFPGRGVPFLRLSLHLAVLAGLVRTPLADPAAQRSVVTEYMYRLLVLQSLTGAISALAPLTSFLPKRVSETGCVACGNLTMIQRHRLVPCNHFCCYACKTSIFAKCPRCGCKIDNTS
jgi:hypothetical protein